MLGLALAGALLAGVYGMGHDQITYTISPEYFTKLKFHQYKAADFGLGNRVFVSTIGFLASWWVGLVIGWFLARRLVPGQDRRRAYRQVMLGFSLVLGCGLLFGILGWLLGSWGDSDSDFSNWDTITQRLKISDVPAFVQVAYIHNASYLGGLVGFLLSLWLIRPVTEASSKT